MDDSVEILAPAKLNLFLEVLGKRSDGYHELESILQTISLYDELVVQRTDVQGVVLECDRAELDTPDNLVIKAAHEFFRAVGASFGVKITLRKRIPIRSGMGGGSSDAVATLNALNALAGKPLSMEQLLSVAARVGSDAPFFVRGGMALVRGRGELVEPLEIQAAYKFLILFPGFGMSTAEVYKNLTLKLTEIPRNAKLPILFLARGDLEAAAGYFFNRLEETACGLDGRLVQARAAMQRLVGDGRVLLSGSGASLFSAFVDHHKAYEAYRALRGAGVGEVFLVGSVRPSGDTGSAKGVGGGDF